MGPLPVHFFLAACCGIWEPTNLKSNIAKLLYKVYSFFNVFIQFILVAVEVGALFTSKSLKDFAQTSYVGLAFISAYMKGLNILWRRKGVKEILDILLEHECTPKDVKETELYSSYNKMARSFIILLKNVCTAYAWTFILDMHTQNNFLFYPVQFIDTILFKILSNFSSVYSMYFTDTRWCATAHYSEFHPAIQLHGHYSFQ